MRYDNESRKSIVKLLFVVRAMLQKKKFKTIVVLIGFNETGYKYIEKDDALNDQKQNIQNLEHRYFSIIEFIEKCNVSLFIQRNYFSWRTKKFRFCYLFFWTLHYFVEWLRGYSKFRAKYVNLNTFGMKCVSETCLRIIVGCGLKIKRWRKR